METVVLWTKLWYYEQNYGTMPRIMELRFMKEKMVHYQKLRKLIEKCIEIHQNN